MQWEELYKMADTMLQQDDIPNTEIVEAVCNFATEKWNLSVYMQSIVFEMVTEYVNEKTGYKTQS